ncbi:hypothetical protein [Motilibacter deserti]|uniref:Fibronectin type-III domain-containing protein n=1 Tax=Motilibacter deserti TaxID=2714956 RepID=A0ABX0GYJ4_9ACTN|nr:hypothetical protein [Motilibacter deserti]NHC14298.1 hypothetical protein [Motilibacter deserti]
MRTSPARPLLAVGLSLAGAVAALAAVVGTPAQADVRITLPPIGWNHGTGQPGTTTPAPACDPRQHGYQAQGSPGVTPAAGALVVTWKHMRDPDVTAYRVAAVPKRLRTGAQPAVRWTTVKPPSSCYATMKVTIRGLDRKAPYDVWLDVVVKRTTPGVGGTRDLNLGRSGVVWTR